jgi:glutamate/tyrosine decarboxylase-like PLP-dependent enzyme
MKELLGIRAETSHGLTTGAGLANAVGVATDRHAVLAKLGWDVETRGLYGSPEIEVIVGDEAHATLLTALQYLGLGRDRVTRVPVATRDSASHRAAMAPSAPYLMMTDKKRESAQWVLDASRRARGFALYAVLRSLGRAGVRDLVERCCTLARRIAERLSAAPGVSVLNEVSLNQVLVRFGDDDERTRTVIERVQREGVAWMGGTTWHGRAAMRISVSNWSTTEVDIDQTAESILRAAR